MEIIPRPTAIRDLDAKHCLKQTNFTFRQITAASVLCLANFALTSTWFVTVSPLSQLPIIGYVHWVSKQSKRTFTPDVRVAYGKYLAKIVKNISSSVVIGFYTSSSISTVAAKYRLTALLCKNSIQNDWHQNLA